MGISGTGNDGGRQQSMKGRKLWVPQMSYGGALLFAVVNAQREEIDALRPRRGDDGSHQHDGLPVPHDDRPVGLSGHFARLDRKGSTCNFS